VIDTGSNAVSNSGLLEATGSGGLVVDSGLSSTGLLWANGGDVTVHGDVTGAGNALISGAATLEFGAASDAHVVFDNDAAGVLALDASAAFTGSVSGFGAGDSIDLGDVAYGSSLTAEYVANDAGTGGTLTLSDGTHSSSIAVVGQYAAAGAQADSQGGTLLAYDAAALDHSMIGGAANDILFGGAGNDIIYGATGADTLTGASGADTFRFMAADSASVDTITDFNAGAGGDVLNISDLITGTFAGNESSYLSLRESGGNTIVSVDRDGAGSAFGFEDFVVLQSVTGLNLDTLVTNGNIYGGP
jgi:Ca2+-binding RTX toxin-like protein